MTPIFTVTAGRMPALLPDARFFRPRTVAIPLLERVGRRLQCGRIVRSLVSRHARPILRFRRCVCLGQLLNDLRELALRVRKTIRGHRHLPKAEAKLGQEVVRGEKSFDAMTLTTFGVENQDGGSPLQLKTLGRGGCTWIFDVNSERDEIAGDQFADLGIRINLGFQPSTTPSHRRCCVVEEQRLLLTFRFGESFLRIFQPFDSHKISACDNSA